MPANEHFHRWWSWQSSVLTVFGNSRGESSRERSTAKETGRESSPEARAKHIERILSMNSSQQLVESVGLVKSDSVFRCRRSVVLIIWYYPLEPARSNL